jgi:hypothetical protein
VKSPTKYALIAAIAVEAVNLRFAGFPIDVGLPPDTSLWTKLVAYQWLYIHLPALILVTGDYFEKLPQKIEVPLGYSCLYLCGYAETVLILLTAIFLFRLLRRLAESFTTKAR